MDLFRLISPSTTTATTESSPLAKPFDGGRKMEGLKVNNRPLRKQPSCNSSIVEVTRVAPSSPLRNQRKQQQQQQQQQKQEVPFVDAQVDGRLASAARRRQEAEEERRRSVRQRTERRLQLASRRAESVLSDRRRAARRQDVRIQLVRRRRLDVERRETDERRRAAERKEWEANERRRRHLLSRRRRQMTRSSFATTRERIACREKHDATNNHKKCKPKTKDTAASDAESAHAPDDGSSTQDRLDRARRRRELCEYERRAAVLATLDRRTATASKAVERRLTLKRNRAHRTVQYAQQVARTVRAARRIQRAVRRQQQQQQQQQGQPFAGPPTSDISQNVAATRMQQCVAWRQVVSARSLLRDEQSNSNTSKGDGSFSSVRTVLSVTVPSSSTKATTRDNSVNNSTAASKHPVASFEEMQRFMMQPKNLQAARVVLGHLKPSLDGVSKTAAVPLEDRALLSALLIATHPTHVLGQDYQQSDKANGTLACKVLQSAGAVLHGLHTLHQTLLSLLETTGTDGGRVSIPALSPIRHAIAGLIPALVSYATLFATWKRADLNDLLASMTTSAQQSWSAHLIADKMLRYVNAMASTATASSSPLSSSSSRRFVAPTRRNNNEEEANRGIDVDEGSTGSGYTATSSSSSGMMLAEQPPPAALPLQQASHRENLVVVEDVLFPLRAHHEAAKEGAWKHLARLRVSLNKLVGRDEGYRMIVAAKGVATQRLRRGNDDGLLQRLRSEVDQLWNSTRSSSSSCLEVPSSSELSLRPPTQEPQTLDEQQQERGNTAVLDRGSVSRCDGNDETATNTSTPDRVETPTLPSAADSTLSSFSKEDAASMPNATEEVLDGTSDTTEGGSPQQNESGDATPTELSNSPQQNQSARPIPDALLSNAELVHSILLTDPSDFYTLSVDGEDDKDKTDHVEEFMEQWATSTNEDGDSVTATVVGAMERGSYEAIHALVLDLHRKMRGLVPNRTDLHSHLDDEAVIAAKSARDLLKLVGWAAEAMASHLESPMRSLSTRQWLKDTSAAMSVTWNESNTSPPPPYGLDSWEKFTLASVTFLHFKADLCKRDIANAELRQVAPVIHRVGWGYELSRFQERFGLSVDGTVESLKTRLPATWAWIQRAVESHHVNTRGDDDDSNPMSWSSNQRLRKVVRERAFVHNLLFAPDKFALPEIFAMDAGRITWLRDEVRYTVIASSLALHAVNVSRASSSSLRLGKLSPLIEEKRQELRTALRKNQDYKSQEELIATVSTAVAELSKALHGGDLDSVALTMVQNCASCVLKGDDSVFRLLDNRVRQFFQSVVVAPTASVVALHDPAAPPVMRTGRGGGGGGGGVAAPTQSAGRPVNNNETHLAAAAAAVEKEAVRLGFSLFSDDLVRAGKLARQVIGVACRVHGDLVLDPMMRDYLETRNAENVD